MNDSLQTGIRRTAEMAAVFMIGDGLLGLLQPERHVDLWRSEVDAVDLLVRPFGGHPGRRRLYGLAQIAAGVTLAAMLRPVAAHRPTSHSTKLIKNWRTRSDSNARPSDS